MEIHVQKGCEKVSEEELCTGLEAMHTKRGHWSRYACKIQRNAIKLILGLIHLICKEWLKECGLTTKDM